ncbi:MAG: pyridoxamine 5'-phosphate oxidase family protein [Acidimicrobiia bacterium]|nr:pyridoxamine 5'-phosphate oxidase family protein [Acidimicrobiia bacterium]MDH5236791.1 pyridoxamine 5'-phosphate oxidase family protein [Acidimicrobiia bacterium]
MALADEKYVALTTHRADGTSTSVPVWIADFGDGRLCFTTSTTTLKARRVANDARVALQPCNARGVVQAGTTPQNGSAMMVTGADFETAMAAIKAKYGFQVTVIQGFTALANRLGSKRQPSDTAMIITLD